MMGRRQALRQNVLPLSSSKVLATLTRFQIHAHDSHKSIPLLGTHLEFSAIDWSFGNLCHFLSSVHGKCARSPHAKHSGPSRRQALSLLRLKGGVNNTYKTQKKTNVTCSSRSRGDTAPALEIERETKVSIHTSIMARQLVIQLHQSVIRAKSGT